MQLVDRIEKRRFVGREFLLFLWFESEVFDATLQTREHGPFGLWLERRLVLSEGKESTRITAPMPGAGREAKEALRRGQLPESAGIRVALRDDELSFVLKGDTLAVAGLKLQTVLDKDEPIANDLLEEILGKVKDKPIPRLHPDDEPIEAFYERMRMTADFEQLFEALFRDFLELRLSAGWDDVVAPALSAWARGEAFSLEAYEALRRPPVERRDSAVVLSSAASESAAPISVERPLTELTPLADAEVPEPMDDELADLDDAALVSSEQAASAE